jgi:hypothetical protein
MPMSCLAAPMVFSGGDSLAPGNVVMLHGGDLGSVKEVMVKPLPNGEAVPAKALQACDNSVKFKLPASMPLGVYSVQCAGGKPFLLNRPEIWFLQPTVLQPGLNQNQAPPDCTIQVVGKNFLLPGDKGTPRISLRRGGKAVELPVENTEKFSLLVKLPADLAVGSYDLLVHNGFGGDTAWSKPLKIEIKKADLWPDKVFNVKELGAKGDGVADDTAAIRDVLDAVRKNGGGVVVFPWGTYRLNDWIHIPEKTVIRGAGRDATILKWPVDEPQKVEDFTTAAIYAGNSYSVEDLTILVRKTKTAFLDMSQEMRASRTVPPELTQFCKPWGHNRDKFLRRLRIQHWLLVQHPEDALKPPKPVEGAKPDLTKIEPEKLALARIYEGVEANTFTGFDLRNLEVSDCEFQGGRQIFANVENARIVRNSFTSTLGYCYTLFGGGAIDLVCEGNFITGSSSFGWGWNGMQRVYSAHNVSNNFVRGEREAMTLDISAMPTARAVSQYWGTPINVGTDPQKPILQFPPAKETNIDGFKTGWVPGCFRGGTAFIRAYDGGTGGGQFRQIVDNSEDTIILASPFNKMMPETTPRRLYMEIAPRHYSAHGGTTAWVGRLSDIKETGFTAVDAKWIPQEFVGMAAFIIDGRGVGQYRVITSNTENQATLDRPWDVVPDAESVVSVWSLMRHMVVYACEGYDTSAFAQLYGSFYDYIVDRCKVERTQGIWGQMGWFVQMRDNTVKYAYSYHKGITARGPNPEGNIPYGITGLTSRRLRLTKGTAFQFPDQPAKNPIFVDTLVGATIPTTLGLTLRGNNLQYGQRLGADFWWQEKPGGPQKGGDAFLDVVAEGNHISHSDVGVQIGPDVGRAVLINNTFDDVAKPISLAMPEKVLSLEQVK